MLPPRQHSELGRVHSRSELERRLVLLAEPQHGVVTADQLHLAGLSRNAVYWLVAVGRLYPIHRGIYAIAPRQLLKPQANLAAAVLACGAEAALGFQSAAWHARLISWCPARLTVVVPGTRRPQRPNVTVKRSTTLRAADIELVDGIPTTTVARTLFDLAGKFSTGQLERAIDEAAVKDREAGGAGYPTVVAELQAQLAHNHGRRREAAVLRRLLAQHSSEAPDINELERVMRDLIAHTDLPMPEVQRWIELADGGPMIQPDFLWRDVKLIVETDGFREHGKRTSFEADRERDQRAAAAGFMTTRVTRRQLREERVAVAQRLARIYRARGTAELL